MGREVSGDAEAHTKLLLLPPQVPPELNGPALKVQPDEGGARLVMVRPVLLGVIPRSTAVMKLLVVFTAPVIVTLNEAVVVPTSNEYVAAGQPVFPPPQSDSISVPMESALATPASKQIAETRIPLRRIFLMLSPASSVLLNFETATRQTIQPWPIVQVQDHSTHFPQVRRTVLTKTNSDI